MKSSFTSESISSAVPIKVSVVAHVAESPPIRVEIDSPLAAPVTVPRRMKVLGVPAATVLASPPSPAVGLSSSSNTLKYDTPDGASPTARLYNDTSVSVVTSSNSTLVTFTDVVVMSNVNLYKSMSPVLAVTLNLYNSTSPFDRSFAVDNLVIVGVAL